jgi:hypothetical protein
MVEREGKRLFSIETSLVIRAPVYGYYTMVVVVADEEVLGT